MKELFDMTKNIKNLFVLCLMVIVLVSVTGCSTIVPSATPTSAPTEIPSTSTPLPSPTPIPPTATPEPTSTVAPTATQSVPLAVAPDGINPWCLTKKYFSAPVDGPNGPASMPEKAVAGTLNKKTNVISFSIPAISCTLVLAFNQPVPRGMKLEFWDARPQEPFITYDMTVNPNNPNEAYAVFSHSYLVDPPKWWMDYTIVVVTADGNEVFRSPIHVQKPLPPKCWDGSYPNPITEFCPIQDS
jgi:hypothetical protein